MDEKKQSAPEDQQLLIYDYMIEHRVLETYVRCVPNCTDLFTEWEPKRTVKDFYDIYQLYSLEKTPIAFGIEYLAFQYTLLPMEQRKVIFNSLFV